MEMAYHGGFASPHAGVLPGRFRPGFWAASGLWFRLLPGRFRRLLPGRFKLVLPAWKHLAEAPACRVSFLWGPASGSYQLQPPSLLTF